MPAISLWGINRHSHNCFRVRSPSFFNGRKRHSNSRYSPPNLGSGSGFGFSFPLDPFAKPYFHQKFPFAMSVIQPSISPHVLVTGGTGFAATALIDHLLHMNYVVHATYRRQSKPKLHRHLETKRLRYFEADILSGNVTHAFQQAAKGCQYAVHLASPMIGDSNNAREELIAPAVDGTVALLNACKAVATVKRVIVVSSHMAVAQGGCKQRNGSQKVFTESDWNQDSSEDHLPMYYSKTMAEKAAWDFIKNEEGEAEDATSKYHPDNRATKSSDTMRSNTRSNMQVIVVNPAYMWGRSIEKKIDTDNCNSLVAGETLHPIPSSVLTTIQTSSSSSITDLPKADDGSKEDETNDRHSEEELELNVSKEFLVQLIRGNLPGIIDVAIPVVHVRDVAKVIAHLLQSPTAEGRYIVCPPNELVHIRDIVKTMRDMGLTKPSQKDLTNGTLTSLMKIASHVTPGGVTGQYLRVILANPVRLSNERITKEMGADFEFTHVAAIVRETISEIVDGGYADSKSEMKLKFSN